MKRVLMTGATSYLGARLAEAILKDGTAVYALVRGRRRPPRGVRPLRYDGSMRSVAAAVARARPDAVFHLASLSLLSHAPADVDLMETAIFRLGAQLADASARAGVHSYVMAGSYWQQRGPADPAPVCLYAAMKTALEDLLLYYSARTALRTASLRLFGVYGPGDARGRMIGQLVESARSGRTLDLTPGRQTLEMLYIDDAVGAFRHAARMLERRPALSGRAWAVGSGERTTLRELVRTFSLRVGPVKARWGGLPYRPGDVMVPWDGPRLPGWRPKVKLAEGLRMAAGA